MEQEMIDQSFSEHTSVKSKVVEDILDCNSKDESGLNDFQKLPTSDLIAIPRVGINRYRLPIELKNKFGVVRSHDCEASMFVNLDANKNGVSMSRLCTILQAVAATEALDANFFKNVLRRYRIELADEADNKLIESAYLKINFNYPNFCCYFIASTPSKQRFLYNVMQSEKPALVKKS